MELGSSKMSSGVPKACTGCGHPFHPADNCHALEAGRCPCERNMAIFLDIPGVDAMVDAVIERGSPTLDRIIAERDELRAEIAPTIAANERLTRERDELRAEVERLRESQSEIIDGWYDWDRQLRDAKAEVERLQRENGALAHTYAACEEMLRERTEALNDSTDEEIIDILLPVEDLRRENADLRAEVERIADVDDRLRAELDRVGSTRDILQAEVERLKRDAREVCAPTIEHQGREIERLTRINNQAIERMRIAESRTVAEQERREDAEAAAERLRKLHEWHCGCAQDS